VFKSSEVGDVALPVQPLTILMVPSLGPTVFLRWLRPIVIGLAVALAWPGVAAADHDGQPAPVNDDDFDAWEVELNTPVENHVNSGAGEQPQEWLDCDGSGYSHTVWYLFEVPSKGRVVITVTGASFLTPGAFDSVIALSPWTASVDDEPITCNDDGPTVGGSRIERDLQPNTYYLQVGGYDDGSGPDLGRFTITVQYTEDLDRDDDGSTRPADCNDDNPAVRPGVADPANGVDDNCDGVVDPDRDSDGHQRPPYGGDCNDNNPGVKPGVADPANGVDDNCDGVVDPDGDSDGYPRPSDCDDARANVNPGATDVRGNKLNEDCRGEPAPFRRLRSDTDYSYNFSGSGIVITTPLEVQGVPKGARVALTCRRNNGSQCGKFRERRRRRPIAFEQMRGKQLPAGTVIVIRVTKRNHIGRFIEITIRRGSDPRKDFDCMNPGSSKPRERCPSLR
jgi:Putative metal-binding motif